ncbi:MAG TPA: CAP domain-containing protein [Thermoanaerobaculia bacterium]|nr:CAP domain-containing protein [Thermoanaerobaculia bacterium]
MRSALLLFLLLALPLQASDDLRKYALKLVNRERARLNLAAVKLDPEINRYAEERARQVLAGKEDGLTPYMRWSFAGKEDRVSENVAGWAVSYKPTEHALRELVRQSHESMMTEEPPLHGRRAAILDPHATHAGIAIVWEGKEFRLVEELVRRYVTFSQPLPRTAAAADKVLVAGRPRGSAVFDSITVHHEPLPDRSAKPADGLPAKRKEYLPKLGSSVKPDRSGKVNYERYQYAENRFGEVDVKREGDFSFAVPFTEGPGIYTIAVWVTVPEFLTPFAATNVSVRVEELPAVNLLPVR